MGNGSSAECLLSLYELKHADFCIVCGCYTDKVTIHVRLMASMDVIYHHHRQSGFSIALHSGSRTRNRVWHLDAPQRQSQVRKEKSEAWKCFGETNDRSSQLMNVGALSVFGFPKSFLSDQMPHLKQRTLSFPTILCTFSLGLGQECALLDPLNGYFYFQL